MVAKNIFAKKNQNLLTPGWVIYTFAPDIEAHKASRSVPNEISSDARFRIGGRAIELFRLCVCSLKTEYLSCCFDFEVVWLV